MSYDYFDEEEWYTVRSPKHPLGSVVAVTIDSRPDKLRFPEVSTKGWHGRVEKVLCNGQTVINAIQLDSLTLAELPDGFLQLVCEECPLPCFEFTDDELEAAAPRDTLEEATAMQRSTYHRYFWGDIKNDKQAVRIHSIMMQQPSASDLNNWLTYFQNEVEFPIPAVAAGLIFNQLPHGTPVEVVDIEGIDEDGEFGLIASVKKGRAIISYPLMELGPAKEEEQCWPIRDYQYWADFML